MSAKRYNRTDLDAILAPLRLLTPVKSMFGQLEDGGIGPRIDEAGLWPTEDFPWLPARELSRSVASARLSETPALPFPFDAGDLAAFLLDGFGHWVREFYTTEGALDVQQLRQISTNEDYAQEAVKAAFTLVSEAAVQCGAEPDINSQVQAWETWRMAMVRHLLTSSASSNVEAPTSGSVAAPPATLAAATRERQLEVAKNRRDLLFEWYGEELRKGRRGAIQRTADRAGMDRSNCARAIRKAEGELREARRAGALLGPLGKCQ